MKQFVFAALLAIAALPVEARKNDVPLYKKADAPIEQRVEDLLSRMTLQEKAMQLTQGMLGDNDNVNNIVTSDGATTGIDPTLGSVIYFAHGTAQRDALQKAAVEGTRLGIPVIFGFDVIHGYRTIYPMPIGAACSFNPEMVRACCAMAAREARYNGVDWTFSPMIDIARDPRWGRIAEGYGEDPYTTAVFARTAVEGYQGDDLKSPDHVAACLKHFVGYGASEGGRDYVYTEISDQTLWDTYLPPYWAGVDAGARTLMSAFNNISGIPATANHYTLTEVLRDKWGFNGFVVADWEAVIQLCNQNYASDGEDASLKALTAGVDMDMIDGLYPRTLQKLVDDGRLSMDIIDEAVRRVLRVKFELGLFENPYAPAAPENEPVVLRSEDVALSEKAAEQTMVLLKNDGVLPFGPEIKKIAVVGPLATENENLLGSWWCKGETSDVVGILDAFKAEFDGKAEITYAKGCNLLGPADDSGFPEALHIAAEADVVVACLGESRKWSGENASRASIQLQGVQQKLLEELHKAGKPVVLLLVNGRPMELTPVLDYVDAIVDMWQPGIAGGKPAAGVVSGRINPSGRLAATFPRSVMQIPIYYNRRNPSRFDGLGYYQDLSVEPLYEFGYGLSYSTFEYSDIRLSADSVEKNGHLTACVDVTNTSSRDGMETVFWYVSDPACSVVTRPCKELRHFEKALIPAGQTRTFTFEIDPLKDLGYINKNGELFLEEGPVVLLTAGKQVRINVN